MFSSVTLSSPDRSLPATGGPAGIMNEAQRSAVAGEIIAEATRRVTADLRPDACVSDDAIMANLARRTLDELAASVRHDRDRLMPRGGREFCQAADKVAVLDEAGSAPRERLASAVIAEVRRQHAEAERASRLASGMDAMRRDLANRRADALQEIGEAVLQAAADAREGQSLGGRLHDLATRFDHVKRMM
jgi:hypothetical protein